MKPLSMAIAATVLGLGICPAQQIERTFERTLNISGPANLDLTTDSGGIAVTAGCGGSVRIRGILKSQGRFLRSADVESRIRQLETNPPIEQSGNTIRVGYVSDRHLMRDISLRLEIVVPAEAQVRARADSGGIRVEGVRGPVDCKTDSGGINASHIQAEVRAVADSGGIHLRDVKGPVYARADSGGIEALEIAGSIDAKTDSGGLRLSQTVAAPVHARTDSGGATLTLASAGGYDLRARTESGRLILPEMTMRGALSKHEVEGKVRSGGPLVDVQVSSGNIDIR
ncbi:MAG TPA: DUF4097 family beta strand repeat-containing protein [Bryobacteraceae bacterium]